MYNFYIRLAIYFVCFLFSLYGLSAIDFEKIIRKGRVAQTQILYYLLAMGLAYLSGSFLMALIYYFNK